MGRYNLVHKCEKCVKADLTNNRCLVFTEPSYMWRKGKCWGYKPRLVVYLGGSIRGKANRGSAWLQYHASAWYDDMEQALAYLKERGRKLYGDLERVKRSPGGMAEGTAGTRYGRGRVCGGSGL